VCPCFENSWHDEYQVRVRLAQLSFTCRAVFLENNSMSNFMSGGESHVLVASPCALTLWEWASREADQRVGQRVGCLAIEVVKLLVKLLMKLYQTGPYWQTITFWSIGQGKKGMELYKTTKAGALLMNRFCKILTFKWCVNQIRICFHINVRCNLIYETRCYFRMFRHKIIIMSFSLCIQTIGIVIPVPPLHVPVPHDHIYFS
jgi:hypothetical protein